MDLEEKGKSSFESAHGLSLLLWRANGLLAASGLLAAACLPQARFKSGLAKSLPLLLWRANGLLAASGSLATARLPQARSFKSGLANHFAFLSGVPRACLP
jgi:hypothetical protein